MRHTRAFVISLAVTVLIVVGAPANASAQLNTQHIKGVTGLKAGSQPPPHVYLIAALFYLYGRPGAIPTAPTTTRAWACGDGNRSSG